MANTVNITQFNGLLQGEGSNTPMQVANTAEVTSENVTSGASSAQSSAMSKNTRVVRVATDTTVRIAFGANPTAAATSTRLLADTAEYFGIQPGWKVAVINE